MAVQGPVIDWVADHRKHHAHADHEGDPHSPHVGHGDGVAGVLRGLWHAHVGWLLDRQGQASTRKYARDLYEDRGMRRISRASPASCSSASRSPRSPAGCSPAPLAGAATGLLWGGLVRIFFVHHVTWSVNSVCHFLGNRRFETDDHSTNVPWLSLLSFGESWHHNHHAFPRSAEHGLRRWERALDPSALVIRTLEKLGLARKVVRIAPERQLQRERGAAARGPARRLGPGPTRASACARAAGSPCAPPGSSCGS